MVTKKFEISRIRFKNIRQHTTTNRLSFILNRQASPQRNATSLDLWTSSSGPHHGLCSSWTPLGDSHGATNFISSTLTHRTTLAQCTGAGRVQARPHGVQLSPQPSTPAPRRPLPVCLQCRLQTTSSLCQPRSSRHASPSSQQLWSAGFFCGRPCDMELVTRQCERSGHQQRLLQAFTEDVFIFSLLVYIAHYSFLDDALCKCTYLLTYLLITLPTPVFLRRIEAQNKMYTATYMTRLTMTMTMTSSAIIPATAARLATTIITAGNINTSSPIYIYSVDHSETKVALSFAIL